MHRDVTSDRPRRDRSAAADVALRGRWGGGGIWFVFFRFFLRRILRASTRIIYVLHIVYCTVLVGYVGTTRVVSFSGIRAVGTTTAVTVITVDRVRTVLRVSTVWTTAAVLSRPVTGRTRGVTDYEPINEWTTRRDGGTRNLFLFRYY